MNDSILTSIKLMLGVGDDYTHFDPQIIAAINSELMVLNQMGIGPPKGVVIKGPNETWDLLVDGRTDLEAVKTAVYKRAQLIFDPPSSGFVVESTNKQLAEFEWRLMIQAEGGPDFGT